MSIFLHSPQVYSPLHKKTYFSQHYFREKVEFFRNCIIFVLLCSEVQNSAKKSTAMGIEHVILGLLPLLCLHSHALTPKLTCRVFNEGCLTSLLLVQLTLGPKWFSCSCKDVWILSLTRSVMYQSPGVASSVPFC